MPYTEMLKNIGEQERIIEAISAVRSLNNFFVIRKNIGMHNEPNMILIRFTATTGLFIEKIFNIATNIAPNKIAKGYPDPNK